MCQHLFFSNPLLLLLPTSSTSLNSFCSSLIQDKDTHVLPTPVCSCFWVSKLLLSFLSCVTPQQTNGAQFQKYSARFPNHEVLYYSSSLFATAKAQSTQKYKVIGWKSWAGMEAVCKGSVVGRQVHVPEGFTYQLRDWRLWLAAQLALHHQD